VAVLPFQSVAEISLHGTRCRKATLKIQPITCGDVPKIRARRIAVSTVMAPLCPLTIALDPVQWEPGVARPSSFRLTPISSSSSRSNSPGWMGGQFPNAVAMVLPLSGNQLSRRQCELPSRHVKQIRQRFIDLNAVLAGPGPFQRLQPDCREWPPKSARPGRRLQPAGARFARLLFDPAETSGYQNPSWIALWFSRHRNERINTTLKHTMRPRTGPSGTRRAIPPPKQAGASYVGTAKPEPCGCRCADLRDSPTPFRRKSRTMSRQSHCTTMHYNFVRIHQTLRVTPAMAAGVTNRLWSIEDVVNLLNAWSIWRRS